MSQPTAASTVTSSRFDGMICLDTSQNTRIPVVMELVGALSRAETPQDVHRTFATGMRQMYGPRGYISLSTRGLEPGEYRVTRALHAESFAEMEIDSWSRPEDIPVQRDGFLGSLIRSAYPEVIHGLDVPDDPVLGDFLSRYGSLMAIPLFDHGEPLNWAISLSEAPDGFTVQDLEEQILRANLVGGTVRNTIMAHDLQLASERIRREMERIADIQRALLPETLPQIPGTSIAASYETFDQAGGDLYMIRPLQRDEDGIPDANGPWAILIADASGHGPAAAVVIAMLHAIVHAYPGIPTGPAEVLDHANEHLTAKRLESSFVTAFLGIYDPKTRRLTYSCAGHNPPLLKDIRKQKPLRWLDRAGGFPLGILDDARYEQTSVVLEPDETIVLYTDGITEAMNTNRDMFGTEGIEAAMVECTGESHCVIHSVLAGLRAHEGGRRPSDDQTIVAMQIMP